MFSLPFTIVPIIGRTRTCFMDLRGWITFEGLADNSPLRLPESGSQAAMALLHAALLLGPLLAPALLYFREKPLPSQACVLTALLFFIIHFTMGRIIESRLWFPAYLFLLPAAFLTLERLWYPGAAGKSQLMFRRGFRMLAVATGPATDSRPTRP